VEEIEREREAVEGEFCPSKKRPEFGARDVGVGSGGGAGTDGGSCGAAAKRSLDRRTTALKVEGLHHKVAEDAIKEHFSKIGTVTSVRLNIPSKLSGSINDQSVSSFALVNFVSRADAERAMTSDTTFDGRTLTCTWHNPTSSSSPSFNNCAHTVGNGGVSKSNFAASHDASDDLYNDVGETGRVEEHKSGEALVPTDNEKGDYVYNEEEDYLVDYD